MTNISQAISINQTIIKPVTQHQNDDIHRAKLQEDINIYGGVRGFGYRPMVSSESGASSEGWWRLWFSVVVQVLVVVVILSLLFILVKI